MIILVLALVLISPMAWGETNSGLIDKFVPSTDQLKKGRLYRLCLDGYEHSALVSIGWVRTPKQVRNAKQILDEDGGGIRCKGYILEEIEFEMKAKLRYYKFCFNRNVWILYGSPAEKHFHGWTDFSPRRDENGKFIACGA